MSYLDDDFLLRTPTGRALYHEVAADAPIIDYHCHLSPREIADNQRWETLTDLWLGGDHYKWRAMRSNGVPEELVTGDADPRERFRAWADTVEHAFRNPLYDWTHLELRRYFGITELLGPATADAIYDRANEALADPDFCAHGILGKFRVRVVGTTDDPADSLVTHERIAALGLSTQVVPTFRPDKALAVDQAAVFQPWLAALERRLDREITSAEDLLAGLRQRHDDFHAAGGRASDHGLLHCYAGAASAREAERVFQAARAGQPVSPADQRAFAALVMLHVGRWNAERNWAMQLHVGVVRNTNSGMFERLGPDTGFDTIAGEPQAAHLLGFLDALAITDELPRTILYSLNPTDNDLFASIIGAFQDGRVPGKIQLGSAWWFNDTKRGMEAQINALSDMGLLSRFVGMLTDSRSFLSYPRHEYFRRLLCGIIGREVDAGELPDDRAVLDRMVRGICHDNAAAYFGWD